MVQIFYALLRHSQILVILLVLFISVPVFLGEADEALEEAARDEARSSELDMQEAPTHNPTCNTNSFATRCNRIHIKGYQSLTIVIDRHSIYVSLCNGTQRKLRQTLNTVFLNISTQSSCKNTSPFAKCPWDCEYLESQTRSAIFVFVQSHTGHPEGVVWARLCKSSVSWSGGAEFGIAYCSVQMCPVCQCDSVPHVAIKIHDDTCVYYPVTM